jgi:hypothetical protein
MRVTWSLSDTEVWRYESIQSCTSHRSVNVQRQLIEPPGTGRHCPSLKLRDKLGRRPMPGRPPRLMQQFARLQVRRVQSASASGGSITRVKSALLHINWVGVESKRRRIASAKRSPTPRRSADLRSTWPRNWRSECVCMVSLPSSDVFERPTPDIEWSPPFRPIADDSRGGESPQSGRRRHLPEDRSSGSL